MTDIKYTASRFNLNDNIEDTSGFDFLTPSHQYQDFNQLTNVKKSRKRDLLKKFRIKNTFVNLTILGLLVLIVGALTYLAFSQNYPNNAKNTLAVTKGTSIVPGNSFVIIANKPKIDNLIIEKEETKDNFDFYKNLPNKPITTKYYASLVSEGKELKSGVEITDYPFDRKLDFNLFTETLAKNLGGNWKVGESTKGVKNVKLGTVNNSDQADIKYYTTIANGNYYIIKEYKQLQSLSEASLINEYTGNLIQDIYFN